MLMMKNLLKIHSIQWILIFLDTFAKVILGGFKTRSELKKTKIDSKIGEYTKEILDIIERRKGVTLKAKHMVLQTLDLHINNLESTIKKEQQCLDKNRCKWSDENAGEREELIEDLKPRLENKKLAIEQKGKALKNMITRKKKKLVILRRLGFRKASTGRPLALDDVDDNFLLQCIENKSTAHGRRNDSVMYVGRHVKKCDFQKIANMSRMSNGLKSIKSVATVCNMARPKNKRSIQAKIQLGLGLFCCKKPLKLTDVDTLLTHHQRAFKRNRLMK